MAPPSLPSDTTLKRYGLSAQEWLALAGDACAICERPWESEIKPATDHQHVRGFNTMSAEERKKYIRGVVCMGCNYFILVRQGTPLKHRNAAAYLGAYEERRQAE